jgi:hypothetical protein
MYLKNKLLYMRVAFATVIHICAVYVITQSSTGNVVRVSFRIHCEENGCFSLFPSLSTHSYQWIVTFFLST